MRVYRSISAALCAKAQKLAVGMLICESRMPEPTEVAGELNHGPWWLGPAGLLLGIALALATYGFLDELDEPARRTAGVLALMATWWLTGALPLAVTSLAPLVLFPLLGVLDAPATAAAYGNRIIFLFLGGFLLALSMERWNLHRRIALRTVLGVGTQPIRLIGGFMLATAVLSMWMSNTASVVMMLPIGMSIITLVETRTGRPAGAFGIALMLGIAYAASIGGVATPIGSPPNAILLGLLRRAHGLDVSFFSWMAATLPFVIVMLAVTWLLLTRVVHRIELRELPGGRQMVREEVSKLGRISGPERSVLVVFGLAVTGWLIREPLKTMVPSWSDLLTKQVDDAAVAIAASMALFVIPVDLRRGEFVMNWATAKRVPWDVLLLFGGGLALAAGIEESGLGRVIGEQLSGLGKFPLVFIILAVTALSVFMSEVTSNTAQANVMLPVLGSVAVGMGHDPVVLLLPACIALSCAFMMPMGTPPNALVFGSGRVTIGQMARAGLVINVCTIVLSTLLALTGAPKLLSGDGATPVPGQLTATSSPSAALPVTGSGLATPPHRSRPNRHNQAMPYVVRNFEPTPNPTAVKCVLDRIIAERPRSFLDAASAGGDPIASALFALPGVRNILISGDWITVNTMPGCDWRTLKPAIKRILSEIP